MYFCALALNIGHARILADEKLRLGQQIALGLNRSLDLSSPCRGVVSLCESEDSGSKYV
jgi:hypothetical protein